MVKPLQIRLFARLGNYARARVAYGALFLSHPLPCGHLLRQGIYKGIWLLLDEVWQLISV